MMKTTLRGLTTVAALTAGLFAWAAGPSGGNYAIPLSTLNSGVGSMASASYALSSSLGELSYAPALASPDYQVYPGFWSAIFGVPPGCLLDIDGNGIVDASTDGLMILRAMFGVTGASVTAGAIGPNPQRSTWAEIQPLIHFPALDIDGNGTTDALTDGLIVLRAMLGLTGTEVTNGAVAVGAPRATWADIRGYLNANCGVNFAQ